MTRFTWRTGVLVGCAIADAIGWGIIIGLGGECVLAFLGVHDVQTASSVAGHVLLGIAAALLRVQIRISRLFGPPKKNGHKSVAMLPAVVYGDDHE